MSRNNRRNPIAAAKGMACAIYTRKSTEDGLEQEFNSLDAQRESGEAYIQSQIGEGWTCLLATTTAVSQAETWTALPCGE